MKLLNTLNLHYIRTKRFYARHERLMMPLALVVGFIFDYITFTNIKISAVLTVLLVYWLIAGLTITFLNYYDAGKVNKRFKYIRLFSSLLLQFLFGALLGGVFVFYWFSGSFFASWPFFLILVGVMVSNDMFKNYFLKPVLQISAYFFISFLLFSVALPFVFYSLSPWLFIAAGVVSTIYILSFIWVLVRVNKEVKQKKNIILSVIAAVLLGMNLLYFTNIIPPIPLSVREAGVYHYVEKVGSEYILEGEEEGFWQKIIPGQKIHIESGQRVYVFTSVFAPVELSVPIWHHWEYYDKEEREWIEASKISFHIKGGREEGYRGFTWKRSLHDGLWRVSVKTARGQVLGRIKFRIVMDSQ